MLGEKGAAGVASRRTVVRLEGNALLDRRARRGDPGIGHSSFVLDDRQGRQGADQTQRRQD